jgi:Leucine-rich repeat (LRR) protein
VREAEHDRLQGQPDQPCPAAALPPQLRWLILTDNCISQLPDELGQRPLLQLMLAGNRLAHLPESLAQCQTWN